MALPGSLSIPQAWPPSIFATSPLRLRKIFQPSPHRRCDLVGPDRDLAALILIGGDERLDPGDHLAVVEPGAQQQHAAALGADPIVRCHLAETTSHPSTVRDGSVTPRAVHRAVLVGARALGIPTGSADCATGISGAPRRGDAAVTPNRRWLDGAVFVPWDCALPG